jgi:hypothetical protein
LHWRTPTHWIGDLWLTYWRHVLVAVVGLAGWLGILLSIGCALPSGAYGPGAAVTDLRIAYADGTTLQIRQATSWRRGEVCISGELEDVVLSQLGASNNLAGSMAVAGAAAGGVAGGAVGVPVGATGGGLLGGLLDGLFGAREVDARCWELER